MKNQRMETALLFTVNVAALIEITNTVSASGEI